jgi:hypothetical protein
MRKTDLLLMETRITAEKSLDWCPTNFAMPLKSRYYSTADELTRWVWLKSKFRRFLHSNSTLRWSLVITKNFVSLYKLFLSKYSYLHQCWGSRSEPIRQRYGSGSGSFPFLMKVLSGLKKCLQKIKFLRLKILYLRVSYKKNYGNFVIFCILKVTEERSQIRSWIR